MYKRLSMIMFPLLVVALIGTGLWGYLEHQEKNSVLVKAENQYQRAFHDLSYHVDKLHTELGNTLAVKSSSTDAYKKGLINVWRITSEAQSEITQLPLSLLPFNKTEDFLSKISTFAYRTAVRDLTKQPISEDEVKTLNTLYQHADQISKDLRGLQSTVISQNLRWMDVEMALASQKEPQDNAIIDGFTTMDKKVSEYPEISWSPTVMGMYKMREMSTLSGPAATAEEIKKKASEFLGLQDQGAMQVVENGNGTQYQSYSVYVPKEGTQDGVHMDYSKNGGSLLWFSAARNVTEKKLDLRQARDIAAQFLDEHGYKNMKAVSYDEYNNLANITFAAKNGEVINFLEKAAVKVALDNGEVTALDTTDYVFDKKERQLAAPKLSADEAKKGLNPNFQVESVSKALIHNDLKEEVQCYQFIGRINGGVYRIYLNADTAMEEQIERIRSEEAAVNRT